MGKWKAVQQPINTAIRLYDLETDLGETTDLAAKHPEIVALMKQRMEEEYTPSERWKMPQPRPMPPRNQP
jgi:hypothetical protein